jgi:hypothetical protein
VRPLLERLFSLVSEQDFTIRGPLAGKATLVHQVMIVSAEQYQVVQARFTTIGPVSYVVSIDKSGVGAAGEAATTILNP